MDIPQRDYFVAEATLHMLLAISSKPDSLCGSRHVQMQSHLVEPQRRGPRVDLEQAQLLHSGEARLHNVTTKSVSRVISGTDPGSSSLAMFRRHYIRLLHGGKARLRSSHFHIDNAMYESGSFPGALQGLFCQLKPWSCAAPARRHD